MSSWRRFEVKKNSSTDEYRVIFFKEVDHVRVHLVLKFFSDDVEFFTFKVFIGGYDQVSAKWGTKDRLNYAESEVFFRKAEDKLSYWSDFLNTKDEVIIPMS